MPGFAYHVTHGVRLSQIQRTGLQPEKPGVQLPTKDVFYGTNLKSQYSAYGTTIVSRMTHIANSRFVAVLGPIGYTYFQGVSVLRTPLTRLNALGFIQANANDWVGPEVPPVDLELFIDNTWQSLQTVKLGTAQVFWRAVYLATPILRN
jgi:hypothetical protein